MANVLLVEDDPEQLELRRTLLERSGHRVGSAHSAAEALELLSGFEVIVMDLRIPEESDGLNLIRAIGTSARIIVLSGGSPPDVPVDVFLSKPCPTRVLLDAIARLSA
jgi:CheY-like chemotaxis protein